MPKQYAGKVVISRQLRRKQVIDFLSKIPPCLVGHGSLRNRSSLGA
jgi:hypothetical protein